MSSRVDVPASQPSAISPGDEKARARARIGMTINNKWRIDALLGVGGMASVYAATHRNGSRAALKILHTEFARDPGIRDRFLREGYVANKVEHHGRVAIQDDDVTEQDEPFLVMELLEGETAQQLWKRKSRKVPPAEALWIAAEVLDTLEGFHVLGIVHRDIKPANLFLTRGEGGAVTVKILDFGVAKVLPMWARRDVAPEILTRTGAVLGSPLYMAPEQARGAKAVDHRADVWSLGVVLYQALAAHAPNQEIEALGELIVTICTLPPRPVEESAPWISPGLAAIVHRALRLDPNERFQTAAAMHDAILAELGEAPSLHESMLVRLADDARAHAFVPTEPVPSTVREPPPVMTPADP
jgi:eukaryotic-like serine/threonine-protein kinase